MCFVLKKILYQIVDFFMKTVYTILVLKFSETMGTTFYKEE